ncbi:recombinase family protein, partial [Paenibacillus shunpengii]
MKKEYCLYLRKSRSDFEAEARGEGETLARHEKTLMDIAKRMKINITNIYKEVVSGETIDARPEVQKLLHDVEVGKWAGVLVVEIERLARGDTVDQGIVAQAFKYSNTKIITPVKTYDPNNEFDEEYFEFGLFMSRREFKTINRRLQGGRIASVNEGKYIGSKPPYGYERVKLKGQKGFTLSPIAEQAEIVKLIFDLYTHGEPDEDGVVRRLGTSLIARKLNLLQVPTSGGGMWVTSTIQHMLRNPVYKGKIKWGTRPIVKKRNDGVISKSRPRVSPDEYKLVDGLHEAIVTEEVWELAQKYLSENPAKPLPNGKKVKNPLSGLVRCGKCGRYMVRRPNPKNRYDTLMCQIPECTNVSSALDLVENRIIESLKYWLKNYKAQWEIEDSKAKVSDPKADLMHKALKEIETEHDKLNKQMDNLHDLLEQGLYTTDKFIERSKNLSQRITENRQTAEDITNELNKVLQRDKAIEVDVPKFKHVIDTYFQTQDPELRNNMLKEVIEKAEYEKEKGTRWHGSPDEFQLK